MKKWKTILCLLMALTVGLTALLGGCAPSGNHSGKDDTMNGQNKATNATALSEPAFPKAEKQGEYVDKPELDEAFLKAVIDFCTDATALAADTDENFAFSPVSLYMALAMSSMGADGQTLDEMLKTFHMEGMDKESVAEQSKKLFENLYFDSESGKTYLANSVWIDDQLDVKEDFYKLTAQKFYAPAFNVDLQDKKAQQAISDWVEKQTNGKVTRPVPDEVPPTVVMSLINAIYFIDQWSSQFDAVNTVKESFTLDDGSKVDADFMKQRLKGAPYVKTDDFEAVTMYFMNGYAVTFYLPSENNTAKDLLAQKRIAGNETVDAIYQFVDIALPKFDIQSTLELNSVLDSLGIVSALNPDSADFSGMSDQKPLFISSVVQSSAITVNEKGCEAAAYTEITMEATGIMEEPTNIIPFTLDRPFAFILTDPNHVPLFTGVVENPAA